MRIKLAIRPSTRDLHDPSLWLAPFLLLFLPGLMAAPAPEDPLVRIQYDYELASYCGLISPDVSSGFKRQMDNMVQHHNYSRETILKARSKASVAVYREWQNRSLGGFKGWCRKEGSASVQRFTSVDE